MIINNCIKTEQNQVIFEQAQLKIFFITNQFFINN